MTTKLGRICCYVAPAIAMLAILAGCDSTGPQGKLKGKVTIKGAAPPAGTTVSFIGDKGAGMAATDATGNYTMAKGVPVGAYTVVLAPPATTMSPEEAMKATMAGKPPVTDGGIPKPYTQQASSPAKVEIKAGEAEYNLDITE